jgi:polyhydroxybutyrate depolymerase
MASGMRTRIVSVAVLLGAALGCGAAQTGGQTGTGGSTSATGGQTGTGGLATGGVTGTGGVAPGTGGTATGGIMGTGGSAGAAGGHGGGAAGAHGGAGGGTGGGAAGMSGTGGSSSAGPAKPSPGCGKSGRPSGGQVSVANTSLYIFPTGYDGTKPFPLLIALHACGNPNTEFVSLTDNTGFATDYVRSFPNTPDSGQCWSNYSGDVSRILSQYDDVMNNYCIDQNRVFAIAHSSGAQMLVNILSHKSDAQHLNLKGISPVAADPYNVAIPMPVLYIDGQHDNQRSANSATDTVAKFRAANMCMTTSTKYDVMTCNSTDSGHPLVDPGCIKYDGCSVPTIWCSHNDPSYSGTEHGVPCFAIKAMQDFFAGL